MKPTPVLAVLAAVVALGAIAYRLWAPGEEVRDGRYDLGRNGLWLQHGWLGDDGWFAPPERRDRKRLFRDPAAPQALALLLRRHHVADVFPHLCPTNTTGRLPAVDAAQTERFLDAFEGFRVLPWVGGVWGKQAFPDDPAWRARFAESVAELLRGHSRLAGVHLDIEPCVSGDASFLALLDALRAAIPDGKVISVAAPPPPLARLPFRDGHWARAYAREVARRVDQVVVMLYDTGLTQERVYRYFLSAWTREVLGWGGRSRVLLGLPAYGKGAPGRHEPTVENLATALRGVHAGLTGLRPLPASYQGVALYCEWEMDEAKWQCLRERFLKPQGVVRGAVLDGEPKTMD